MNDYSVKDWDELYELSEEALLIRLGMSIPSNSIALIPHSDFDWSKKAEIWLKQKKSVVCQSTNVINAVKSPDRYIICAAVADAIGGAGAATAAVLIVKKGLEKICQSYWTEMSDQNKEGSEQD